MLTVIATIDGRKERLVVDTGWAGEGISLQRNEAGALATAAQPMENFRTSARGGRIAQVKKQRAQRVLLGNVQLAQVPIFVGDFPSLREQVKRQTIGGNGIIGAAFLRACSGIIDLQNLRLYLRPSGTGRRVDISGAMRALGLAEVRFEQTSENDCLVDVEINGGLRENARRHGDIPCPRGHSTGEGDQGTPVRYTRRAPAAADIG